MPAKAVKRDGPHPWRVVNADTGEVIKGPSGNPVDGGGHTSRVDAVKQASAVNANEEQ